MRRMLPSFPYGAMPIGYYALCELLHRARVQLGLISEYAAVSPTECNFHSYGAYAREAMLITASDDAERKARMLALSLVPCVACEVALEQAD